MPAERVAADRLHFLDGLRGLSALYVLLFHAATVAVPQSGEPSAVTAFLQTCLSQGRASVVFFIVLSGFSLMLPIARSGGYDLAGGFTRYVYRRARRIFPPYYAALAGSIVLIVAYNAVAARLGMNRTGEEALTTGSILSHLLLVHNLSFDWAFRINGPMWSVATEWQIYFLFPFLLLPLFRSAGPLAGALIAYVISAAPFFLLPSSQNLFWACPWFVGSFAIGMFGALLTYSPSYQGSALRDRVPWGAASAACFALIAVLVGTGAADRIAYPLFDALVSLLALTCIAACVKRERTRGPRGGLVGMLSSPPVVYLGGFSYSLYLVQHPLLRLTEKLASRLPMSYDAFILVHVFLMSPLVIAGAWLFSEFFERPFTRGAIVLPAVRRRLRAVAAG